MTRSNISHKLPDGVAGGGGAPPRENSSAYPEPVERLISELSRMPGVGRRSAERLAFHVLKSPTEEAMGLARAVEDVKRRVRHCPVCFNLCQGEVCAICQDPSRDRRTVLVVEQPKDLIALEQTGGYRGLYHVLMGRLSPLEGVDAADLTVEGLLARVDHPETRQPGGEAITEVILGLNPTLEGDGTALYLQQELASRRVSVTRLARGLPTGSELQFANKAVLMDALEGRTRL